MERTLKETIIYGGAFNPPTLAHQAIVQGCIAYAEPRQADVWLLPSASRRDKIINVTRERRTEFCRALLQDAMSRNVSVTVNTMELDRGTETETYQTVCELDARYPGRKFKWVFGSDSIASMPTWRQGKWLQNHLAILAIDRPGEPHVEYGMNVERLVVETGDIRSTEVRRRLCTGESYNELVGVHVGTLLARRMVS